MLKFEVQGLKTMEIEYRFKVETNLKMYHRASEELCYNTKVLKAFYVKHTS